ncbi:DegT/DnrJ/EryC1/StrS family aminotransferase [Fuerstiella marisgermanici]|uniref:L-glutamine:2-deoxy-scyllo-inosose aminotransferase n=1 Tax=Fuerstiella marisgermanici TaxID=1891926 RepID=A0A1P8WPU9_9PLAN|nr:aminotransferase class V-fold PLP-dependent enzyme [Fuerstiella marisgermanici]APZ96081.1 L-glutamine:2-deoxy-scyllo-inosose aminotransferase [Fuerstiella marisgermanici]
MTSDGGSTSDGEIKPPSWPITDDAIRHVFAAMLHDGSWGRYHGPHCDNLRRALAEFHNVDHVVLCSSGTAAVELALRSVKVQPGDEVILAAYEFKANFANVVTLGATPVLVDTLPGLPVLDPTQLPNAITARTRAIICSHLHGSFARMAEIQAIADEHRLPVVEDACQSPGAILNGRMAGSIGNIGVLSFGGSKLLTAGRGGAVITNDPTLAQRIRLHTQRGNDAYPLSEMQAAVLLPQLNQLADRNQLRLQNVEHLLQTWPREAPLQPALSPSPHAEPDASPAYYKVAFRYIVGPEGRTREAYSEALRRQGVALDPAFSALHKIHSQRRFRAVGELPNASDLHDCLMTLHHPALLQPQDVLSRLTEIVRHA